MREINYLDDIKLSWKAKGLLSYIKAHSSETNYESLITEATDGITSLQSGIKELVSKGYYINYPIRDNEGKFVEFVQQVRYDRYMPENSSEQDIINAILFFERWEQENDNEMLRRAIGLVKGKNPDNYKKLVREVNELLQLGHKQAKYVKKFL